MTPSHAPFVLANARIAAMHGDMAVVDGHIAVADGRVVFVGPFLPDDCNDWEQRDCACRLVTPGLIDCHTHIVHGGDRAREFAMRLEGASYEEIAKAGGGIVSTVAATRALDEVALLEASLPRVDALIAEGVTAIEIKSGYGLTIAEEMKMLRVARRIGAVRPITVRTSWLAAHALPAEYKDRADAYIDEVAIAGLRHAHAEGLVDAFENRSTSASVVCLLYGFGP